MTIVQSYDDIIRIMHDVGVSRGLAVTEIIHVTVFSVCWCTVHNIILKVLE